MSQSKLVITTPDGSEREVLLEDGALTVGRASASDIALPDARVSRLHATVSAENSTVTIRNESTSNLLRLNGLPIEQSQLTAGDIISIGNCTLRLVMPQLLAVEEDVVLNTEAELAHTILQTVIEPIASDTNQDRLTISTPLRTWDIALDHDITIGRGPTCNVVLDLPNVSREHAALEKRGDQIVVRDLNSSNGTRLNGIPVMQQALRRGDTIQIGAARLVFKAAFEPNDVTMIAPSSTARPPVIFVPGIMGSQLWRGSEQIWPRAQAFFSKTSPILLPDHGQVEARGIVNEVLIIPNFLKQGFYQPVRDLLTQTLGYELNNDYLEFAYDWRQDIRQAARQLAKTVEAWGQREPITLIAHSMGTLVSRYFVECLGGHQHIGHMILMGGPHLGTIQATKSLIHTPFDLPFGLLGERLRKIVLSFPSMYQLLPRFAGIHDSNGNRIDMLVDDGWLDPAYAHLMPLAHQFHSELGTRCRVPAVSIFGYGQSTLDKVVVERNRDGGWESVKITHSAEGDGVVPSVSAMLPNTAIHPVKQAHSSLFQDSDVQMRLRMSLVPLPLELM